MSNINVNLTNNMINHNRKVGLNSNKRGKLNDEDINSIG